MDHKAKLDAYRKKPNIIPAVVYQTWHTKDFHPVWAEQFRIMKEMNKHIEFKIFSDHECREYIKNNFDKKILWAYDSLNPTAYKADLWRYCVLYKEGGIYLDIKLVCYEIDLLRKEDFLRVKDIPQFADPNSKIYTYENEKYSNNEHINGIWQAVMATRPKNVILKDIIDQIVFNTMTHYYGPNPLSITGPAALCKVDNKKPSINPNFHLSKNTKDIDLVTVMLDMYPIIFMIMGYREYANYNYKKNNDHSSSHYSSMWLTRDVYCNKHPKAFACNYIGYRGITNNITSVCPVGDGLFLIESFDNAKLEDNGKISTSRLKTNMSIYDNRSNTFSLLPTPESLITNRIIGCLDPQIGDDSIITFNAYINDTLFTVLIPGPENIKNRHKWSNLKGYYSLFCDNRGNKIAMHIRHPNIEFYKLDARDTPIIINNPITTIKINQFFNSVDWISNGMTIGDTVWFLMRRTKYNNIIGGHDINKIDNSYVWLLVNADVDKYNLKKISNAFTFNESAYSKISNLMYDFRSKAITLSITSIDSLPKSYSYGLETIESELIWNTF
jgi:hypothetical protein